MKQLVRIYGTRNVIFVPDNHEYFGCQCGTNGDYTDMHMCNGHFTANNARQLHKMQRTHMQS